MSAQAATGFESRGPAENAPTLPAEDDFDDDIPF
jgi:hypothetical protein